MRAVVQRVSEASVCINGETVGKIGKGFMILLGVTEGDTPELCAYLAEKCAGLRVFSDENDKMNLSLKDVAGEVLVISQFTLYGDCRKGKRPSFIAAAKPETAIPLYERFIAKLQNRDLHVETGRFGADMKVSLVNDGPVTLILDSEEMRTGRVDK